MWVSSLWGVFQVNKIRRKNKGEKKDWVKINSFFESSINFLWLFYEQTKVARKNKWGINKIEKERSTKIEDDTNEESWIWIEL